MDLHRLCHEPPNRNITSAGFPSGRHIQILQNFRFQFLQKAFIFLLYPLRIVVRGTLPVSQRLGTLAVIIAKGLEVFAFFEKRFDLFLSIGKSPKKTEKAW
jgi:hypothetical protein